MFIRRILPLISMSMLTLTLVSCGDSTGGSAETVTQTEIETETVTEESSEVSSTRSPDADDESGDSSTGDEPSEGRGRTSVEQRYFEEHGTELEEDRASREDGNFHGPLPSTTHRGIEPATLCTGWEGDPGVTKDGEDAVCDGGSWVLVD